MFRCLISFKFILLFFVFGCAYGIVVRFSPHFHKFETLCKVVRTFCKLLLRFNCKYNNDMWEFSETIFGNNILFAFVVRFVLWTSQLLF